MMEVEAEGEENFRAFVDVGDEVREGKRSGGASLQERLARLRAGVVGRDETFASPFGEALPLTYADWTASGRAFAPVERFVNDRVYPLYANTHTSTSVTGLQSTCFRAEARQIIQQAVNANTKTDVVLFAGSGATGAVNKLVGVLALKAPVPAGSARPVVLVGPFEHHSNLLPWRESNADVVCVRENQTGTGLDREHLVALLEEHKDRPLVVGAFSAASNVTGIMEDVDAISAILHRHGALAVWDYAAAGPYAVMDMNPVLPGDHPDRAYAHKDAIFVSPHKFVGGINSPGVLVAKKRLFSNAVPGDLSVGGGTVYFVKQDSHRYLSNRVEREEGGTPDVVGAIRAGLAFQLKQSIGAEEIKRIDDRWVARIRERLGAEPNIALLGPDWKGMDATTAAGVNQLPIASFLVRHGTRGLFLHYNFVAALLNDLYGVQTRGGCMCAGPYAQRLLGMSQEAIDGIERELVRDPKHCEYLRPGFTRLSLAYFCDEAEVDFVLQAVCDVARDGWKLLPLYRFNTRTGEWKHRSRFTKFPGRRWLDDANLLGGDEAGPESGKAAPPLRDYDAILAKAREVTLAEAKRAGKESLGDQTALLSENAATLRWFVMPSEAQEQLASGVEPAAAPASGAAASATTTTQARPAMCPAPGGHDAVMNPAAYWESLRSSGKARGRDTNGSANGTTEEDRSEPKAKRAKTGVDCVGDVCFKPRKKDKFPLRTAEVIREGEAAEATAPAATVPAPEAAAEAAATSSSQLVGLAEMTRAQLFPKPPRSIMRSVGKAMGEWGMIEDGDRLLLGLSGGKDSLCLLHVLLDLQQRAPIKFELAACTIDPVTESFDPSPLIPYMKALGVTYHYIKDPIFDRAKGGALQGTSICAYCARMKRGALYSCAREHKYNKLVLAQHLDDLAESTIMSMLHNGQMRSMMAKYKEKKGDVTVIRPLVYTREAETRAFSYSAKLPVINENCPACFEAPQERKRIKKLLAKEEATYPNVFNNLRRALVPLMDPAVLANMVEVTKTREALGKPSKHKKNNASRKPDRRAGPKASKAESSKAEAEASSSG